MKHLIMYYLIFISVITFIIFSYDKICAILKRKRISEKTLLILSALGGCFIEYLSMYLIRHKIRKSYFHFVNIVFIAIYVYIYVTLFAK